MNMARLTATWIKLTTQSQLERSSQTVSVVDDNVYIFGGELQPRKPRDNDVHVISLKDDAIPHAAASALLATANSPPPRVGSAAAVLQDKIYLFSGRGGIAMTCLQEQGALWVFDTTSSEWSMLSPIDPALPYPEARSYHTLVSDKEETLYLHAGCPAKGRLSDLWAFHIPTRRWTELNSAPEPARGGTSIAFSGSQLYRMNGFDGEIEQGGVIDIFDPKTRNWTSVSFSPDGNAGPGPRSVSCLLAVTLNHKPSLLTMLGERNPSSLGHEGAGKMLGDIWVFDIQSQHWIRAEAGPSETPAARGWFDADVVHGSGNYSVVVHGGLDELNERLGDVWLLEIT